MERIFDLEQVALRDLNQALHDLPPAAEPQVWRVLNPKGEHAIACGIDAAIEVHVMGPVGYYCAGMNKHATVVIHGNAGTGVASNMMSGFVRVKGNASQSAGATGRGGTLVIEGDAAGRCGISLKGLDIVVRGSVGHLCAFMAQKGNIVICGNAGHALGDSIYEANLFVKGSVADLGADCEEKAMTDGNREKLAALLETAEIDEDAAKFRHYGSARRLYHFHVDNADAYA